MGKFFLSLLLVAAGIGGFVWFGVVQDFLSMPSFFFKTLLFLFFCTGLIFIFLYKTTSPAFFLHLYLLTITIKLLAYGAYNLIMIFQDKAAASGNVVFFMVTYFIFTVLEISFLYRKILDENRH